MVIRDYLSCMLMVTPRAWRDLPGGEQFDSTLLAYCIKVIFNLMILTFIVILWHIKSRVCYWKGIGWKLKAVIITPLNQGKWCVYSEWIKLSQHNRGLPSHLFMGDFPSICSFIIYAKLWSINDLLSFKALL